MVYPINTSGRISLLVDCEVSNDIYYKSIVSIKAQNKVYLPMSDGFYYIGRSLLACSSKGNVYYWWFWPFNWLGQIQLQLKVKYNNVYLVPYIN